MSSFLEIKREPTEKEDIVITLSPQGETAPSISARHLLTTLDQFLAEVAPTVKDETAAGYAMRFIPFRQWWETTGPPHYVLTSTSLGEFRRWLETDYRDTNNRSPSQSTVRTVIARLRRFLRWLHKTGRLPIDLAEWLPLPPKPKHKRRFLDQEQCQALIDAVPPGPLRFRDWAMIAFLLETGARRFEAAEALWGETVIDPQTFLGYTHLRKVKFDSEGKGLGRVVVFGPTTGRALHQHRLFLQLTGQTDAAGRVFGMSNTAIKMRFRKLSERTGFEVGPHDLRRTFSDWWWEHNSNDERAMVLLKLQLGHSIGEDVTLKHYINLDNTPRLIKMLHASYTSPAQSLQWPGVGDLNS